MPDGYFENHIGLDVIRTLVLDFMFEEDVELKKACIATLRHCEQELMYELSKLRTRERMSK